MPTRTVQCRGPQGLSGTVTLRGALPGVDISSFNITVVEGIVFQGRYMGELVDITTGVYDVNLELDDGTIIVVGELRHENIDSSAVEKVGVHITSLDDDSISASTFATAYSAIADVLVGDLLTIYRGDTTTITITGLGDLSARTSLWFTIKKSANDADSKAQILIEETEGLLYVNGASADVDETAEIAIDDELAGDITITISAEATTLLNMRKKGVWDVQMKTAAGITTLRAGEAKLTKDVTRELDNGD